MRMQAARIGMIAAALVLLAATGEAAGCAKCSADLRKGWRFCPSCGELLGGFNVKPADAGKLLVGLEGPTSKVYRDPATFRGEVGEVGRISLARNEYEAVQIVLYPVPGKYGSGSRLLEWDFGDLTGAQGAIPAGNLTVSPVGYVKPRPEHYGQDYHGAHPDPLQPSPDYTPGAVRVREGELQPLWVLLYAPPDTPPGDYTGTLIIKEGGRPVARVGISAHVWEFSLPGTMHLPAAFDFYSIKGMYPRGPNESAKQWKMRISALEGMYYADMLRHRVSPMRNCGYPRFVGMKGREYVFDFNEFDRRYRYYVEKLHQPRFVVAPEWPGWGTEEFESWKTTGWIGFRNPSALKATFGAIGKHLEARGWLEKAYIYTIDEHPGDWTRKINALIHDGCPGLKNLLTVMVREGYPNVDIWCPRMYELTPERLELGRRFQGEGKELWVYTSGPQPPFPTLVLDWDLVNCRIIPWMCGKFRLDGYLYWCINFWRQDPWKTTATYPGQNGGGFLYYPGRDGPVGSLRLEAFRDGLEDYEYLWLLRELVERARERGEGGRITPDDVELCRVGDRVVRYFDDYTRDPRVLYTIREKIARRIEEFRRPRGGGKNAAGDKKGGLPG